MIEHEQCLTVPGGQVEADGLITRSCELGCQLIAADRTDGDADHAPLRRCDRSLAVSIALISCFDGIMMGVRVL